MTKRRSLGLVMMVLGGIVLFAPILVGVWVIALLGVVLIAAGLVAIAQVLRDTDRTEGFSHYLAGVLTIVLGLVLFLSPRVALSAVVLAITVGLLIDGGAKIYFAFKTSGGDRRWKLFNGLVSIALGFIVWVFITADLGIIAIGLVLGGWLLVEGWTMFFIPDRSFESPHEETDLRIHPDEKLGLEPSDSVRKMRESVLETEKGEAADNLVFCLRFLLLFFLIHLLRTDAQWSFIGLISPFSAVIGDAVMAIIVGVAVILPLRVFVRKVTRPLERSSWRRLDALSAGSEEPTYAELALTLLARVPDASCIKTQVRALLAQLSSLVDHAGRVAGYRLVYRDQFDLGIQLVLQFRELGVGRVAGDHESSRRSVAKTRSRRRRGTCSRERHSEGKGIRRRDRERIADRRF